MALTPVHELQALIHDKIAAAQKPLETETVPLVSAVGRVLAQDVAAPVSIPPIFPPWTAMPCPWPRRRAANGK